MLCYVLLDMTTQIMLLFQNVQRQFVKNEQ
jgi:hypothetical protein